MSKPNCNFSPQKEETTMKGVEQTPTGYTYVHGDNNKRLKLSELITQGEEILDSADASPPRSSTPSPPYKRFLTPDGRFHFETDGDIIDFMNNHIKDLSDEHKLELALTIGRVPRIPTGMHHLSRRCAELALKYYNEKHKDDYKYQSADNFAYAGENREIIHMNFFGSRKVSESRPEPGPQQFFFAELETEHIVLDCCILDSSFLEVDTCADDEKIIHPQGMNCSCDSF